jgi:hypothetical protein
MKRKSLLYAVQAMLLYAMLSGAGAMKAADPAASPSPAASAPATHKLSPDAIKAARLTRLKNTVGLTADQEAKAKPIIDQFVDDQIAAKGDKAKQMDLRAKYRSDIYTILNPDQQKVFASEQKKARAKNKAARAVKAAGESVSPSTTPAATN